MVVVTLLREDLRSRIPQTYLRREPLDAIVRGAIGFPDEPGVLAYRGPYPAALSFQRMPDSYAIELSVDLSAFRRAYQARIHTVDEERTWFAAAAARAHTEHHEYPMLLRNVAVDLYRAFLPRRQANTLSRQVSRSAAAVFAPHGPWHDVPRRLTDYALHATMTLPTPVASSFIQVLDRLVSDLWILSPQYLELRYQRRNADRSPTQQTLSS